MMARRISARYFGGAWGGVLLTVLVGCERSPEVPPPTSAPTAANTVAAAQLRRGADLYAANCAMCHGARAEGAKDWHRIGPGGKVPPPPLDGSAHAWHHSRAQLKRTILEGTQARGGGMPAWRGRLSEDEVEAVIDWFQSLWPPEIYQTWSEMDRKARQRPQ